MLSMLDKLPQRGLIFGSQFTENGTAWTLRSNDCQKIMLVLQ
jgi:hypothetical protein